jgi:hypothetical protein
VRQDRLELERPEPLEPQDLLDQLDQQVLLLEIQEALDQLDQQAHKETQETLVLE